MAPEPIVNFRYLSLLIENCCVDSNMFSLTLTRSFSMKKNRNWSDNRSLMVKKISANQRMRQSKEIVFSITLLISQCTRNNSNILHLRVLFFWGGGRGWRIKNNTWCVDRSYEYKKLIANIEVYWFSNENIWDLSLVLIQKQRSRLFSAQIM